MRRSKALGALAAVAMLSLVVALMVTIGGGGRQERPVSPERAASILAWLGEKSAARVIVELEALEPAPDLRQGSAAIDRARARAVSAQDGLLARHVGSDGAKLDRWAVRRIELFPVLAMTVTRQELAALARDPHIKHIWPDALHRPAADLTLTYSGLVPDPNTGDPGAWAEGADGTGTIIAVLDSGVDGSQPFLAGKVVEEACFSTTNPVDGTTTLCPNGQATQVGTGAGRQCSVFPPGLPGFFWGCDHGTMVAGAAAGKNPAGTSPRGGVAKEARIFSVQVTSRVATTQPNVCPLSMNLCLRAYTSDVLAGLAHVLARAPSLPQTLAAVNLSLWGQLYPDPAYTLEGVCNTHPLKAAIDQLRAQGIPTVVAAGDGQQRDRVMSPGCIESAVTVTGAGIPQFTGEWLFDASNMGPTVDLVAITAGDLMVPRAGGTLYSIVGTSFAAPQVAGAFAALRSRVPAATVDQIEQALKSTGRLVPDTRPADPDRGLAVGTLSRPRIRVNLAARALLGTLGPILDVSPAPVSFRGPVGGPFVPGPAQILVRNAGGAPLSWSAAFDSPQPPGPSRFELSSTSGIIGPYASSTITVATVAAAAMLSEGSYSDRITFTAGTQQAQVPVVLTVSNRPVNDDRADAIALFGTSGSTTGSNTLATHEHFGGAAFPDEVAHFPGTTGDKSVWWRWQPLSDGQATFTTAGSGFDTVLGVYGPQGSAAAPAPVRGDNDGAGNGHSRVSFHAEAGMTYHIAVDGRTPADSGSIALAWSFTTDQGAADVVSAVLPGTRSVQIGQTATAFGTLINAGAAAVGCYIQPGVLSPYLGEFSFRAVTPANTIDPAYGVNQPVDVPAGGTRSFVFAMTPRSVYEGQPITLLFDCENKRPAAQTSGVNSFALTATSAPGPDMIPIAATLSGDGIVNIPGPTGTGVFAASVINIGAGAPITASADAGGFPIGVTVTICETNPATGACLSPPAATHTRSFAANDIATYAVFVTGSQNVPFDPGAHRIYMRFKDAANITRGITSVAVRTQ